MFGDDATRTAPNAWWQAVFNVLDEALELPFEERAAYLERASTGDRAIADAAGEMLAGADTPTFLAGPAAEFAAPFLSDVTIESQRSSEDAEIGPYRILREIGHGGMGTVYLAERADHHYHKQVAIKLLPRWSANNERLVRRFIDERQILAALDHPDIARLVDGGVTADGLPWFALEYVEGVPIDVFCNQHDLSREARLKLFSRVCSAVQYAHRNLVVHRDLKPANILVTAEGNVKLLDFGIAKLLTADGVDRPPSLTLTRDRMMTPLYASPEQLRGDPISTASDVYALGILLNELLTGRYPYRLTTREPHEVARAILEQEPMRPSLSAPPKLSRELRGDLDTIVLKAMQKEPSERYGTAEQLEADVRRHLDRMPLTARPETRASRTKKFISRHRVGVSTAAGVLVLLLAFGVVSAVQAIRIRGQAARITVERDRAEQVSGFLAGLFRASDPYGRGGAALTAREILDSGAVRIDRELATHPDARAQMLFEMGRAYYGLGAWPRARRFVETSLAIRRRATPDAKLEIARTLDFLGVVLRDQGELDAAEQVYRDALRIRRQLLSPHQEIAKTLNGLASALRAAGRFREADSVSRQAVALNESRSGTSSRDLSESLDGLAQALREQGRFEAAEPLFRRALTLRKEALGETHPEVGSSIVRLAAALGSMGQTAAADSLFRQGLGIERRALGDEHPDVVAGDVERARLLHIGGTDVEAETTYRRALAIARRKLPAVHPLTATILAGLGELELDRGRAARAEPILKEALAMRRAVLPPLHPHIAEVEQLVGAAILSRRSYAEAERYLYPSYEELRAVYGRQDSRTRAALQRLIELYQATRQPQVVARYRELLDGRGGAEPISLSRTLTDARQPTGPSGVTVLAFRTASGTASLADLRDWFQDLISVRLGGYVNSSPIDLPPHVLVGEVAGTSEILTITARLMGADGKVRAHLSAAGPADSLPQLADRLAAGLLASASSKTEADSAALARTSLPALRAYLAGRTAIRHERPLEARGHFERANSLDSTFAAPYLWLASLEELQFSAGNERWRYDRAWQHRDALSPAERAVLVAHLGPRYPKPPTIVELITAGEAAARIAPDWPEAWFIAGDNLARFGPVVGPSDHVVRAARAFRRALALDAGHGAALERLIVLETRLGDREALRHDFDLYLARNFESESDAFPRWTVGLALGDSNIVASVSSRLADLPSMDLMRVAVWSQARDIGLRDGDSATKILLGRAAVTSERRVGTLHRVILLMNRGRPAEANRVLGMYELGFARNQAVGGVREFQTYAGLYWDGDSATTVAAVQRIEAYLNGAKMGPGEVGDLQTANCALAHWRVATGDFNGARLALSKMRHEAMRPTPAATLVSPLCAPVVDAELEAAGPRASHAVALARLDSLLGTPSNFRDQLIPIGNLVSARLHAAHGEKQRSLELIRRRTVWSQYLSTQLLEEARLAASTGDRAGAISAYRHYLSLRSEPEPPLRGEAQAVRRELAKLEH